jgi:hypothetical protein
MPQSSFASVDLPLPDSPTMATIDPDAIAMDTSCKMGFELVDSS